MKLDKVGEHRYRYVEFYEFKENKLALDIAICVLGFGLIALLAWVCGL